METSTVSHTLEQMQEYLWTVGTVIQQHLSMSQLNDSTANLLSIAALPSPASNEGIVSIYCSEVNNWVTLKSSPIHGQTISFQSKMVSENTRQWNTTKHNRIIINRTRGRTRVWIIRKSADNGSFNECAQRPFWKLVAGNQQLNESNTNKTHKKSNSFFFL